MPQHDSHDDRSSKQGVNGVQVQKMARPRQVAMALAKELTQLSLPEIGSNFGGRDHTTVLHACRQITKLRDSVPEINRDVAFLLQVLRN